MLGMWASPRWIFWHSLLQGRSSALNTTAGSSCPLLFSLQHTPNFFSAPPPLLSCLTCSSFCPVAEELISERGVGVRNWRWWWWWWCWGPLAGLCCKMAGGGCSDLLHMCSQHLRNVLFSSWGLSGVTSVNKPTCCFLFLSDIFQLLPLQLALLHSYNKTPTSSGTPHDRLWCTTLKQNKWMPTHNSSSVPFTISSLYRFLGVHHVCMCLCMTYSLRATRLNVQSQDPLQCFEEGLNLPNTNLEDWVKKGV